MKSLYICVLAFLAVLLNAYNCPFFIIVGILIGGTTLIVAE